MTYQLCCHGNQDLIYENWENWPEPHWDRLFWTSRGTEYQQKEEETQVQTQQSPIISTRKATNQYTRSTWTWWSGHNHGGRRPQTVNSGPAYSPTRPATTEQPQILATNTRVSQENHKQANQHPNACKNDIPVINNTNRVEHRPTSNLLMPNSSGPNSPIQLGTRNEMTVWDKAVFTKPLSFDNIKFITLNIESIKSDYAVINDCLSEAGILCLHEHCSHLSLRTSPTTFKQATLQEG